MVEPQPSKLAMRVRFPSPAPRKTAGQSACQVLWRSTGGPSDSGSAAEASHGDAKPVLDQGGCHNHGLRLPSPGAQDLPSCLSSQVRGLFWVLDRSPASPYRAPTPASLPEDAFWDRLKESGQA